MTSSVTIGSRFHSTTAKARELSAQDVRRGRMQDATTKPRKEAVHGRSMLDSETTVTVRVDEGAPKRTLRWPYQPPVRGIVPFTLRYVWEMLWLTCEGLPKWSLSQPRTKNIG